MVLMIVWMMPLMTLVKPVVKDEKIEVKDPTIPSPAGARAERSNTMAYATATRMTAAIR